MLRGHWTRRAGADPRYAKLHNGARAGILYPIDDLDAWLEERMASTARR